MARRLTLSRETLTELTNADLAAVVGAQDTLKTLLCLTDDYRTTCLNCE